MPNTNATTWIDQLETIGQLGIATLIIFAIVVLTWKFAPKVIASINNLASSMKDMANAFRDLKDMICDWRDEHVRDRDAHKAQLDRIEMKLNR
jgi:hypothetical protein